MAGENEEKVNEIIDEKLPQFDVDPVEVLMEERHDEIAKKLDDI